MEDFSLESFFFQRPTRKTFFIQRTVHNVDIYMTNTIFFSCLGDCKDFLFQIFQPFPQTSNGSRLIARSVSLSTVLNHI